MRILGILMKRNIKLFFKDKGLFFTSLITPAILLVLYATFLGNVYRDSFTAGLPTGISIDEELIESLVAGQLVSSILAVSCITVAFCSNFLMVQDKANGTAKDLFISPVNATTLSLGYYLSSLISTLLICIASALLCFIYLAAVGWYLSFTDTVLILLDVLLLTLFGTALSSIINFFLSTQGQISAVGSIISSCYGFICGAYMPISSFGEGLRHAVLFMPGTYGTSLLRDHTMRGVFNEMETSGVPNAVTEQLRDVVDCNLYMGEELIGEPIKFMIIGATVLLLIGAYIAINLIKRKKG